MINEYIDRVDKAVEKATLDNGTKLVKEIFELPGMSSREGRILLNELLQEGDKYLEIGVHKGSTFVSALYKNNVQAVAIDNFSEFGTMEDNKKWFDQACKDHQITNFTFINRDCFSLYDDEKKIINGTNVYFYDGRHEFEDQEKAISYYLNYLSDPFIIIIDDWNHAPVQRGTKSALQLTKVVVHKEWILDGSATNKGWHNGMYIAVMSK
jgi:hypothetical protein